MLLKDFLGGLPGAIAGFAAFSFTLITVREWAYHYAIGADFIVLNSPTELTSMALRWMPVIGLAIVLSFVYNMFISRLEGFRSEEEIIEGAPNPRRMYLLRTLPYNLALPMIFVGGLVRAAYDDNPKATDWIIPLNAGWIMFAIWFCQHPNVRHKLPAPWRLMLMLIPFWIMFSFGHGYDEALRHFELSRGEYRIIQSNDLIEDNVHLLRATSKGILVLRLPKKEISFFTYDSFKRIDWTGDSPQEQKPTPSGGISGGDLTP